MNSMRLITHATQDAGNIEQQLLHQKYKIRDILPEQDTMYSVRLGSIPLKHKCDLLINFRSYECSHRRIGGLVRHSLKNLPLYMR